MCKPKWWRARRYRHRKVDPSKHVERSYRAPEYRHLPRTESQEEWGEWEYLHPDDMRAHINEAFGRADLFPHAEIVWINKIYVVIGARLEAPPWGHMVHLYIFRKDNAPLRSWQDLQTIKNEIVDPACTAVEVFPPEDEKVDEINWYHLWVLPPNRRLPFWMGNARTSDMKYYIPGVYVDDTYNDKHKVKTYNGPPEQTEGEGEDE